MISLRTSRAAYTEFKARARTFGGRCCVRINANSALRRGLRESRCVTERAANPRSARIFTLPQGLDGRKVLGADLNRHEVTGPAGNIQKVLHFLVRRLPEG